MHQAPRTAACTTVPNQRVRLVTWPQGSAAVQNIDGGVLHKPLID